jgi:hypothetical protein
MFNHQSTSLVWTYSEKAITNTAERLPAIISGIASEIAHNLGLEYKAGFWNEFLIEGLLRRRRAEHSLTKSKPYSAPSWSWAAYEGLLHVHRQAQERRFTYLVHAEAVVTLSDPNNPYGAVSQGSLHFLRANGICLPA